ncbi:hypothetical protein N431DRAFT_452759 [Stipitochalara longipes BDJ]|nr:hypothetical protein N431DRAFT_452759 [Stipitochalara longipes BDJ]
MTNPFLDLITEHQSRFYGYSFITLCLGISITLLYHSAGISPNLTNRALGRTARTTWLSSYEMSSFVSNGQETGDIDQSSSSPNSMKPLLRTYGTFDINLAAPVEIPNSTISPSRATFWTSEAFMVLFAFSFIGFLGYLSGIGEFLGFIWYFTVCGSTFSPRGPPKTWNDYTNQTFAIGFDLTAGYGYVQSILLPFGKTWNSDVKSNSTAAVMFENGTIANVGRVEGNNEYNEVLARLSLRDSTHSSPPYYNCTTQTNDLGRQWRRYFRRRLGRPASFDVAILASIISDLKHQTNSFLYNAGLGELEIAFMTALHLPALYAEDLADAAEYAKVQMLTLPGSIFKSPGSDGAWVVSEINTAFAGNGLGLSHLYDSPYTKAHSLDNRQIENEKADFELRDGRKSDDDKVSMLTPGPWNATVLSVLFTKTALAAHVLHLDSATSFREGYGTTNFSLELSSQSISIHQTPEHDSIDWHEVRQAIRTVLKPWWDIYHDIRRVIIYGESAHEDILNAIIKEEIQRGQGSDEGEKQPPIFYSEDPVYAAAKGAAILANLCPRLKDYYSCFPDLRPRMQNWFWDV